MTGSNKPTLAEAFRDLPFGDMETVLLWLQEFSRSHDDAPSPHEVIRAFVTAGYDINVNTGIELRIGNPDNYGRYIIGQALYDIVKCGHVSSDTARVADGWLRDFAQAGIAAA